MSQSLALVTLLVPDYDQAITYYVGALGFLLTADTKLAPDKRWVTVHPPNATTGLLLAKATGHAQINTIGQQCGGRVSFFLHTTSFDEDYRRYKAAGVKFCEEPRDETYGRVVVFCDAFGNKWDLLEQRPK